METPEIVNRVANSGLVTLDLETLYPYGERVEFDLAPILFQGLVLREKDLRDFLKNHDASIYEGKFVAIYCSVDAIIPTWAFVLLGIHFQPVAKYVCFGNLEQLEIALFQEAIHSINPEDYKDERVILKGCSKFPVPTSAYVAIANKLLPVVKSLMYGEACSNVPLYKKPK